MKPGIGVDKSMFDEAMDNLSLSPREMTNILDAGNHVIETYAKINHEPNIDTTQLFVSIQSQKPVIESPTKGYAEVWVSAEYAAHLEYGTVKMDAYPFLRPAVYENEAEIAAAMGNVFIMMIGGFL